MKPITVLTPDQAENLLKCVTGNYSFLRHWNARRITGRRKYETRFEAHRPPNPKIDLTWFTTKTLQPRWAPISDILAAILESHAKPQGSVVPRSHQRLRKLRRKPKRLQGYGRGRIMLLVIRISATSSPLLKTFPRLLSKPVTILRRLLNGAGDRRGQKVLLEDMERIRC
jgi:hypothetical protein